VGQFFQTIKKSAGKIARVPAIRRRKCLQKQKYVSCLPFLMVSEYPRLCSVSAGKLK